MHIDRLHPAVVTRATLVGRQNSRLSASNKEPLKEIRCDAALAKVKSTFSRAIRSFIVLLDSGANLI
ncbi:MAG: hypothetical protein ACYDA0_14185 [Candidatus Dormibacteraceae bacterium]